MGASASAPAPRAPTPPELPTFRELRNNLAAATRPFAARELPATLRLAYDDGHVYSYNASKFGRAHGWLVERNDVGMIVVSLAHRALEPAELQAPGARAMRSHVTIVPATWNSRAEFHVTVDDVLRRRDATRAEPLGAVKACRTFYRFADAGDGSYVAHLEEKRRATLPVCNEKRRIVVEHADAWVRDVVRLFGDAQ